MDKKHVLFIGSVWPEPNSSAGGIRMMQLIRLFLSRNFKVIFASVAAENEFSADLKALGVEKAIIELNKESFDVFVKDLNPAIVIFDRFMVEEQFGWRVAEACPNALRIIETIDLHCVRVSRQQALKTGEELNAVLLINDISKREIAAIYRSDLSLIISEAEVEILQNAFKLNKELIFYLPFLLEEAIDKNLPTFENRKNFVTIGNFKHEPNWDSVRYLKENIWPLIREKMPDAQLHIYGSYSSEKVTQLHNPKEGFHIMGRAENAELVMKDARVCLAPLRFGAGIKGKLSQAMLCGTPSVTTSVGAEGMHGNFEWNGIIADEPEVFASAAVKLYNDKTLWEQAQNNGFTLINERYTDRKEELSLLRRIEVIQQNLDLHREKNFIGSMLTHHTMQSSKFLSKWIQEKNKVS
ncbi:MAG: glycosyltransferase family 4 protein [Bacteroidetes bacterium]|nr:glycosyltransferase family 4 protein [Bacteroidota bacterium]